MKDGACRASRDSADRQLERSVPNVWHSLTRLLTASRFSMMVCFEGTSKSGLVAQRAGACDVRHCRCTVTMACEFERGVDARGSRVDQMQNEAVEALVGGECSIGAQNQCEAVPSVFRRSQGINCTGAYARPKVLLLPDDPAHYVGHIRSHRRHNPRQLAT